MPWWLTGNGSAVQLWEVASPLEVASLTRAPISAAAQEQQGGGRARRSRPRKVRWESVLDPIVVCWVCWPCSSSSSSSCCRSHRVRSAVRWRLTWDSFKRHRWLFAHFTTSRKGRPALPCWGLFPSYFTRKEIPLSLVRQYQIGLLRVAALLNLGPFHTGLFPTPSSPFFHGLLRCHYCKLVDCSDDTGTVALKKGWLSTKKLEAGHQFYNHIYSRSFTSSGCIQ